MYDYWNDEPSEYDMMIEDLKESLRESVREEIKDEIESLRNKLAELSDIRDNWSQKVKELEKEKCKYQEAARNAGYEAKKTRLSELMESIEHEAWTVRYRYEYIKPKCDKCDDKRQIHFKSPSGRDMSEDCECAKRKAVYHVEPLKLFKISQRISKDGKPMEDPLLYYGLHKNSSTWFDVGSEEIRVVGIRLGEREHRDEFHSCFLDEDAAKAYADELNNRKRS